MLSRAIGAQRFKPVAWWNPKVAQASRLIEQTQFSQSDGLYLRRQSAASLA